MFVGLLLQKGIKVLSAAITALSLVLAGLIILQVFFRYVLEIGIPFAEEFSRYIMVWITFLGSALAIHTKDHITMNIFINKLKGKARLWIDLAANALVVVFLSIVLVQGIRILPYQVAQMLISVRISIFWFYLAIPIGCALMLLFVFGYIYDTLKKLLGLNEGADGM